MSRAYECDICHALYKPQIYKLHNLAFDNIGIHAGDNVIRDFDICPACASDFVGWYLRHNEKKEGK